MLSRRTNYLRLRGAVIGLLLGLGLVVVHGTVEGFQDGFALDGAPWAPAGTVQAAREAALFDLMNPSALTLAFLLGSTLLGASAAPIIGPDEPTRVVGDRQRLLRSVRPSASPPPSASAGGQIQTSPR